MNILHSQAYMVTHINNYIEKHPYIMIELLPIMVLNIGTVLGKMVIKVGTVA